MRRLMIVGTIGGLTLAAALTIVAVTSDTAEAQTSDDAPAQQIVEAVLDRLVASGIITEERAEELADRIYDSARFQRWAEQGLPEGFDAERFEDRLEKGLDRLDEAREKYGELDRDELRKKLEEFRERRKDALDDMRERRRGFGPGREELREQLSGLDRDEIRDAIENGTLNDLLDTDAIADSMLERSKEALERAVENGRITQAEADEKLEQLEERLEQLRNGEIDFGDAFTKRWRDARGQAKESGHSA